MTKNDILPSIVLKHTLFMLAGCVLLLGVIVLVGWHTHNIALIQVSPVFVPMQYNTALGFAFSGAALLAFIKGYRRRQLMFSLPVFVLGILTLIEYVGDIDLHIDQLFMQHYIDHINLNNSHPGRMAPNTALCFSLTGFTFLLALGRQRWVTAMTGNLGAIIFSLGVVAFVGYLTNISTAYGWGALTKMAVQTTLGFMLLGLGLLLVAINRDHSVSKAKQWLPEWLYWPVLITGATLTGTTWQAAYSHELEMLKTVGRGSGLATESLLVFGIFTTIAAALALRSSIHQPDRLSLQEANRVTLPSSLSSLFA